MDTTLSRSMRLSLIAAALVISAACGGDANEEGAATDTTGTVGAAAGDVSASGGVSSTEAVALMLAANQSEVQAAQVAIDKATSSEVRQFAQTMQREHSQAAHEIGELAKRMNVDLQAAGQQGPMVQNLQQMSQQMAQQLSSTPKGPEFDRVYIDGQVQAHQTVLEYLQRIAGAAGPAGAAPAQPPGASGRDTSQGATSPQQAVQAMIPHVQQHLDRARELQTRLSSGR